MSYPTYPNFSTPQNQGQGLGFAAGPQPNAPGQGPGYPLYPSKDSGFPCPPSMSGPVANPVGSSHPGELSANPSQFGDPYSFPQGGMGSSPYPPQGGMGSAPYPPQGGMGSAPYPPQGGMGSAPYPPQGGMGSAPYPPQGGVGSAPYPPQGGVGSAPYPPQGGMSSSPYPPQGGMGSVSYPPYSNPPATSYPISSPTNVGFPPNSAQNPYSTSSTPYSSGSSPSYAPVMSSAGVVPVQGAVTQRSSYQASSHSGTQYSSPAGSLWPYQERPTLRPALSFDPSGDAAQLKKAMKGFGTDEAMIIRILGRRTYQQRYQITQRYQQSYGKDLVKNLRSELTGQFEQVILALMTPPTTYLAQEINKAITGLGTKENTLIEILCTNDNNTIRYIKNTYRSLYQRPLEADLRGDTSGYFGRLMVCMAAGDRDEMNLDRSLAPGLARSLYSAGVKKLGTDEGEFIRIMSTYSYPVLRCTFAEYVNISGGKTFESAIRSELSGDLRDGMLAIYSCINNRAAYFAQRLQEAMRGLGTKDNDLIRIIVSRSEIDLGNIKDEFRKMYGKRLEDAVTSETSGDYKTILLAVMQE